MGASIQQPAARDRAVPFAVLVLTALVALLALLRWDPADGLQVGLTGAVSGDEPHYLVLAHSVLYDRDLDLANNYQNARAGGPQAGERYRGYPLDPHVILADRAGGKSIIWFDYYDITKPLPAPADAHGFLFQARQPNPLAPGSYVQVPSHPPGFGVLLAALVAPLGPGPEDVERLASIAVFLLSLATLPLAYRTGRAAGLAPWPAVATVALYALCSTWLPYAQSLFSEPAVTFALLLALHEHLRGRSVTASLAAAAAIWMKPYFGLVPACWMLERWLAGRRMESLKIATVVGLGTAALLLFNLRYAAAPIVGGNSAVGLDAQWLPRLWRHLLSAEFGLLVFVPWTATALACLFRPARREETPALRSVGWPLLAQFALFVILPIGSSGVLGPRYWVQFLPWFALLSVAASLRHPRWMPHLLAVLALVGAAEAIPDSLLYHTTRGWLQPAFTSLRILLGI